MEKTISPSPIRPDFTSSQRLNPVYLLPYKRVIVSNIGDVSSTYTNTTNPYSIYNLLPYTDSWNFQDGIDILDQSTGYSATTAAMARIRFSKKHVTVGSKIEAISYGQILAHTNTVAMVLGAEADVFVYNSAGSLQDTVFSATGYTIGNVSGSNYFTTWKHRANIQITKTSVLLYGELSYGAGDRTVTIEFPDSGSFNYAGGDYLEFLIRLYWTFETSASNQVRIDSHYIELLGA